MPRANRHFLPGHVWHITHRCHKREFLLRFAQDRRRWRHWLYVARRRYGLCVLNYIVTSNHVHALVYDRGRQEIEKSMQLVSARTAQEYNQRKNRRGAFWEDRYHATAVQTGEHLIRCLTYIDLNMVRAAAVCHPRVWRFSGYHELCIPPRRKLAIDIGQLCQLVGASTIDEHRTSRHEAIDSDLDVSQRNPVWTSATAVGDPQYLAQVQASLGAAGRYKQITSWQHGDCLKDEVPPYSSKKDPKRPD